MTEAGRRSIRIFAAAGAIAAVAVLTLAPQRFVGPVRWGFMQLMDAVTEPLLVWVPYGDAERMLNTVMFVPLGASIALLLKRRAWPIAIVAGFALSAVVEYSQGSIPGRVPDPNDVLWNTAGAAIGAALIALVRLVLAATLARKRVKPSPS